MLSEGFEERVFQFYGGGRDIDSKGPLWSQAQFQDHTYSAEFVSDPVRSGNTALRLEWRPENVDASNNTSKKAMIHWGRTPTIEDSDRWYGFSMYLPKEDFRAEKSERTIIFQLHATPDRDRGEPWRVPPVTINVSGGDVRCWYTFDTVEISPKNDNIRPNGQAVTIAKLEDVWDRWLDVVLHSRNSISEDGILQVWVDGELVLDRQGINLGYNDAIGPYPSWGIYTGKGVAKRVVYLDEVRIGDSDASYEAVAPGRSGGLGLAPARSPSQVQLGD